MFPECYGDTIDSLQPFSASASAPLAPPQAENGHARSDPSQTQDNQWIYLFFFSLKLWPEQQPYTHIFKVSACRHEKWADYLFLRSFAWDNPRFIRPFVSLSFIQIHICGLFLKHTLPFVRNKNYLSVNYPAFFSLSLFPRWSKCTDHQTLIPPHPPPQL